MQTDLDTIVEESWESALDSWNHPSVPRVIAPKTAEEIETLGLIGNALRNELAFMELKGFQTYVNLEKVAETFKEDVARGIKAVTGHEIGHRFCPYDIVTSIILRHSIEKALEGERIPYDPKVASGLILNLFTDMSINTNLSRNGNDDISWAYEQISKDKGDSKLWKVYAKSMELAWEKKILPEETKLSEEELEAAKELAEIFDGNLFDKKKWKNNVGRYTKIIAKFLEDEQKDGTGMDNCAENIPKELDEATERELAKRLSEIGSNGLPTNKKGLKEYKEIVAGFGQGDAVKASIQFYDRLSDSYQVNFATQPFGRPRVSPFSPERWEPSKGTEKLDVGYSVVRDGRVIPGVNTYSWKTRRREAFGGLEEVVPNLDIYLDSSSSMPNPIDEISLPVLAGFVAAKKAHRKGASIRSTNFSGNGQYQTQESTRDLNKIFENLVIFYKGGTVLPVSQIQSGQSPRQVLVITDTFLGNEEATVDAIRELRKDKRNRATVYALHPVPNAEYLRRAGAEVIEGTTTDIFKKVIGKCNEVYSR